MSVVADPYPADSVNDLKPSASTLALLIFAPPIGIARYIHDNLDKYLHSINTGIADAVSLVEDTATSCPNGKIVMAGYSQGAMVMHQAELQLTGRRSVLRRIAGTLLLADGDRAPYTHARAFGSSAPRGEGIRTYLHGNNRRDVELPATTANICNTGDLVCDFNLSRLTHVSQAAKVHTSYAIKTSHGYVFSPLLAQAANWLANKMLAR